MIAEVDLHKVRGTLNTLARRKLGLFSAFPEFSRQDLAQDALEAVLRASERFNPEQSSVTTFAYVVGARRLIDKFRIRNRERERIGRLPLPSTVGHDQNDASGLADWLFRIRISARAMFGNKAYRIHGRHYRIPQLAALALLQLRTGLAPDVLREMLKDRRDLLKAMGFRHVPRRAAFRDLAAVLAKRQPALAGLRDSPEVARLIGEGN